MNSCTACDAAIVAGVARVDGGRRQRSDREQTLPVDAETFAAGDQHPQSGRGLEELVDASGDRRQQVLAVVEDQQQPSAH